jgi:GNAT superfamily N-acetyltransferase
VLKGFISALEHIVEIYEKNEVKVYYSEENSHFFFHLDQTMYDVGISAGKNTLDVFYDEGQRILFIGLLRLPPQMKGKGLSTEIVNQLKEYAKDHGFTLFLDACGDCDFFWEKQGFKRIKRNEHGFMIMGHSPTGDEIRKKWDEFQQSKVYVEKLFVHN